MTTATGAVVLADSVSPRGDRLTTLECTFPRFILSEVNTHRMLSRNSASSRAIPPERLIERVMQDPFIPVTFNTRVKGMGVGTALVGDDAAAAEEAWLTARDNAVGAAEALVALDCDKSRVNRLLEPFMWHVAIISATEWSNFLALRDHPAAQPEFQQLAAAIRSELEASSPTTLRYGEWHTPLVDPGERDAKLLSSSRCARVSYDRQHDDEPRKESIRRYNRLAGARPPHLSPLEHVARPIELKDGSRPQAIHKEGVIWCGNFRGWWQHRYDVDGQHDAALLS